MTGEILTSKLLTRAGFLHGFSTRRGGVSAAPFDSLDLRAAPPGIAGDIEENLRRFAAAVVFDLDGLFLVSQVHGARVLDARGRAARGARAEADAIVLARGQAGGVRVADCVPVLVGDTDTGEAAAIHAGWRGVEAGVIPAALERLGERTHRRLAAVGPCIGPCCFEVGVDVAARIARAVGDPDVIARRDAEKAFVNLRRAVRAQLAKEGFAAADVEDVGGCTRCDPGVYFSFRRDGEQSGRHMAAIVARAEGDLALP